MSDNSIKIPDHLVTPELISFFKDLEETSTRDTKVDRIELKRVAIEEANGFLWQISFYNQAGELLVQKYSPGPITIE